MEPRRLTPTWTAWATTRTPSPTIPMRRKTPTCDDVGDNADAFPMDATETVDSDMDGVGDVADDFPERSR